MAGSGTRYSGSSSSSSSSTLDVLSPVNKPVEQTSRTSVLVRQQLSEKKSIHVMGSISTVFRSRSKPNYVTTLCPPLTPIPHPLEDARSIAQQTTVCKIRGSPPPPCPLQVSDVVFLERRRLVTAAPPFCREVACSVFLSVHTGLVHRGNVQADVRLGSVGGG